MLISLEQMS